MHYIYILECNDGTLYTGYTTDVKRRVKEHNEGMASKYTRSRLPVHCVYTEEYQDKSEALKRELQIKKLSRSQKLHIISTDEISFANVLVKAHKTAGKGKNKPRD